MKNNFLGGLVKLKMLKDSTNLTKNSFRYEVDYPKNTYRFQVVYELLSISFNSRTRVKCFVKELFPVSSVEDIFLGGNVKFWVCLVFFLVII